MLTFKALSDAGYLHHLIPIIPPDATLSPNSSLQDKDKGKQPGLYNAGTMEWTGFPGWSSGYTTPEDITQWDSWPTHNIGLRTAQFPSIDIDIDNVEIVQQINSTIDLFMPSTATRSRSNSPRVVRVLQLAAGEPVPGKRRIILNDDMGAIELLGSGQQVVLIGTHPSGGQYYYTGIPVIVTINQIDTLWDALIALLGDKVLKTTKAGSVLPGQSKGGQVVYEATDDATYLHAMGHVNRSDDVGEGERDDACFMLAAHIRQHYGLPEPKTLELMMMWNDNKCHPSLSKRVVQTKVSSAYSGNATGAQGEYHWSAAGFGQCNDIPDGLSDTPVVENAKGRPKKEIPVVPMSPSGLYDINQRIGSLEFNGEHINARMEPLGTLDNFKIMLRCYGVNVGYDMIAKTSLLSGPGISGETDVSDNANLAFLFNLCKINRMDTSVVKQYIHNLQNENQVNPVAAWIQEREWDGIDRIPTLFNTLTLAPEQDPQVAYMMFRKWLIGASKIAQGEINRFEFVLVLQDDDGGLGKTRWFTQLCPERWHADGVLLNPADKDSVKTAISYWLVELGELDSIFKKADVKQLMTFLSKSKDEIRLPFSATYSKFQRRTAFFGSVNDRQFLVDDSGDRRFWPIAITDLNYDHGIDMQQVWAQVALLNESHYLNQDENKLIIEKNLQFKTIDPIHDVLSHYFNQPPVQDKLQHLSTTNILTKAGVDKPNRGQLNKAAKWLRKNNYKYSIINGVRGFMVPIFSLI